MSGRVSEDEINRIIVRAGESEGRDRHSAQVRAFVHGHTYLKRIRVIHPAYHSLLYALMASSAAAKLLISIDSPALAVADLAYASRPAGNPQ
jgi:hypothetical protein